MTPALPSQDSLAFQLPSLAANLPPLFLAPPFTPAHPVFQAFSRYAIRASDDLRRKVEIDLDSFLQMKLHELDAAEDALRKDVDRLWRRWREAWDDVAKVDEAAAKQHKSQNGTIPVITNFSPTPSSAMTSSSQSVRRPAGAPSQSLLSASLAQTSSLHQNMGAPSPPVEDSTLLAGLSPPDRPGSSALGPSRLVNDSYAVAASYKLAMDDENEAIAKMEKARLRRLEKAKAKENIAPKPEDESLGAGPSARGRNGVNGNGRRVQFAEESTDQEGSDEEEQPLECEGKPPLDSTV